MAFPGNPPFLGGIRPIMLQMACIELVHMWYDLVCCAGKTWAEIEACEEEAMQVCMSASPNGIRKWLLVQYAARSAAAAAAHNTVSANH